MGETPLPSGLVFVILVEDKVEPDNIIADHDSQPQEVNGIQHFKPPMLEPLER